MVAPSFPFPDLLQRNIYTDLELFRHGDPAPPSHKAGKYQNCRAKSFGELASRLGQRSQLAARSKLMNSVGRKSAAQILIMATSKQS
jgi:hypothetical protein